MNKLMALIILMAVSPSFAKASCVSEAVTAVEMTFGPQTNFKDIRVKAGLPDTYPLLGMGKTAPNVYTVKFLGARPETFVVAFGRENSSCLITPETSVCHGTTSFNAVFEPCRHGSF
jgi:hypothetical protein